MTRDVDATQVGQLARAVDQASDSTQIVRFRPGDHVGPYRLIYRIGQGGMGDVYSADRADGLFRRRVALKLVRARLDGRDLTERFDSERRILATLNHPNIAKMVDGGVTEHGVPYVVMEYVDGLPLDRFCQDKKMPLEERIRLFLQVCEAVQYAHRNLIVHRDIKPDNILVGEDGRPVLLDFGIAKLLRPELLGIKANETRAGAHMMTPEYASPEQFRGDRVSTASDVYSLGVLLYVLVCGKLPHSPDGLTMTELGRTVCDIDPRLPSLNIGENDEKPSPDIDAIVMKALRKEAESRYLSVEELSADLHRYLRGFPVKAREGTWSYSAGKFLRRHRLAAAFSTVIALLLLGSGVVLYSFNRSLQRGRDIANGSVEFIMDLLDGSDPNSRGDRVIAARALLDEASVRLLENKFHADAEVRYMLAKKIGDIYRQLGAYDRAEPLFQLALRVGGESNGQESDHVSNVLVRLADLHREMGKVAEAETEAKRSLELHRKLFGNNSPQVADSLNITGILLQIRGKNDEAEAVFREAVTVRRAVLSPNDPFLALSLGNLGNILRDKGDLRGARQCFEEALKIRRKALGDENPRVASSLGQLSQVAVAEKRFEEALELTERAVRIARKAYQADNPDLARSIVNYGNALLEMKRYRDSEAALKEALEIQRKVRGPEAVETSFVESALASNYAEQGRLVEAESLRRHVLAARAKQLGAEHPRTVDAKLLLGNVLLRRGNRAEASQQFREVLALAKLDPKHAERARNGLAEASTGSPTENPQPLQKL